MCRQSTKENTSENDEENASINEEEKTSANDNKNDEVVTGSFHSANSKTVGFYATFTVPVKSSRK